MTQPTSWLHDLIAAVKRTLAATAHALGWQHVYPVQITLRELVLDTIAGAGSHGMTSNECADFLGIDKGSVQPRTSELYADNLVYKSPIRRRNESGIRATVWLAV